MNWLARLFCKHRNRDLKREYNRGFAEGKFYALECFDEAVKHYPESEQELILSKLKAIDSTRRATFKHV